MNSDYPDDLCPYGCYWDCEHRTGGERARLRPAELGRRRPRRRYCWECGEFAEEIVTHGREHLRQRQLREHAG